MDIERDWWVVRSLKTAKKGWPSPRPRQWAVSLLSSQDSSIRRASSEVL